MKMVVNLKISKVLALVIALSLLAISCEKGNPFQTDDQPIYFEYTYSNMAWGNQFNGWIIDNEGNVRYYNLPDNWQHTTEEGITLESMEINLAQADSIIAIVDSDTLEEKVRLIRDAIEGEITNPVNIANDAGSSSLYAYYWDETGKKYKAVFLAQSGDFESHNKSTAAKSLTRWLKGFGTFWLD